MNTGKDDEELNWDGCEYGDISCKDAFLDSFTGNKAIDYSVVIILLIISILGIIMAIDGLVVLNLSSAQIGEEEEEEEDENEPESDQESSGMDEFHPMSFRRHNHQRSHHHHRHHNHNRHHGHHHRHRRNQRYAQQSDQSDVSDEESNSSLPPIQSLTHHRKHRR